MNPRTLTWLLICIFAMVFVSLAWMPRQEGQSIREQADQVAPNAPTPLPPGGIDQRALDRSKTEITISRPAEPPHPVQPPKASAPEKRP